MALAGTQALKKRCFMVLGAVGSGKTSLLRMLEDEGEAAHKTQSLDYQGWGIDTPGEYAEMGFRRVSLVAASVDARLLVVVQDATRSQSPFPPNYLLMFPRPAVGAITKIDLPNADVERATRLLRQSGVKGEIYPLSSISGEGIDTLRQRLLIEQSNL